MREIGYDIRMDDLPEECRQIAEIIGLEALLALAAYCGGESISLPKLESLLRPARDREIRARFNGRNYRELARQYNLTVRWVRELVSGSRSSEAESRSAFDKQLSLF